MKAQSKDGDRTLAEAEKGHMAGDAKMMRDEAEGGWSRGRQGVTEKEATSWP